MKIFKKTAKAARRAVYYDSLKDETKLVKDSADLFRDTIKNSKAEKGPAKQYSELSEEDVTSSLKTYTTMFRIFAVLLVLGIVYFIYAVAQAHWTLMLTVFFFDLVVAALTFRFHFYLTCLKRKKLDLTMEEYRQGLFKKN